MGVVQLGARLGAMWQAQRHLREGLRLVAAGDLAAAEPLLAGAFELARETGSDQLVVSTGEELYQVLARRRRHDEAAPVAVELLSRKVRLAGAASEPAAAWRNELIRLLGQLGRYGEAETLCRARLALARERRPPEARAAGFALVTLAWCVRGLGRWDEAERLCREGLLAMDGMGGSDAWALAGLAAALLRRLELDQAEGALRRAVGSWASVGRAELAQVAEEQLLDVYVVGERYQDALALSLTALGRARRGAAVVADRERQLRNLERHAFLLQMDGRQREAARYELRADYLRRAIEAEPRRSDGASPDPAGPVFEGEPVLDWELPGAAVALRAC